MKCCVCNLFLWLHVITLYYLSIPGSTVQKMTLQGMLGVFMLLGISVMVGLLILIIEWIYASAKDSREKVNVSRTGFIMCLWGLNSVQRVKRPSIERSLTNIHYSNLAKCTPLLTLEYNQSALLANSWISNLKKWYGIILFHNKTHWCLKKEKIALSNN